MMVQLEVILKNTCDVGVIYLDPLVLLMNIGEVMASPVSHHSFESISYFRSTRIEIIKFESTWNKTNESMRKITWVS